MVLQSFTFDNFQPRQKILHTETHCEFHIEQMLPKNDAHAILISSKLFTNLSSLWRHSVQTSEQTDPPSIVGYCVLHPNFPYLSFELKIKEKSKGEEVK